MTYKQFKKANSLILSVLTAILLLMLLLMTVGCVSKREVVYRSIYFADTNGVSTVIYYPESMEKDLRTPHDNERWKHIAAKNVPDDGVAKEMKPIPTWEQWQQQKLSDTYHKDNPECSLGYHR
jgi:hypothetical protein